MRSIVSVLEVLVLLIFGASAPAEMELGVQMIAGPEMEVEPVSLDDVKLGSEIVVDGYGVLYPLTFDFRDRQEAYQKGDDWNTERYESGQDAEFAVLKLDITNTRKIPQDFIAQCEVKAYFDDEYEFEGWSYQYNHNNGNQYGGIDPRDTVIKTDDNFAIDPMYTGHYCFGCTLPNAVVESKKPLRLVITIGGNEITYNVRK